MEVKQYVPISELDEENLEFFLSFIVLRDDGCWEWTGQLLGRPGRYGFFRGTNGVKGFTSQLAYEHFIGTIPLNPATGKRLTLDHVCRFQPCCNPTHLEAVTQGENNRRVPFRKQRERATHCRQGHELTPENTVTSIRGFRQCKMCREAYYVEMLAAKKAERAEAKAAREPRTEFRCGHPIEDNCYVSPHGVKQCLICRKAGWQRRKALKGVQDSGNAAAVA